MKKRSLIIYIVIGIVLIVALILIFTNNKIGEKISPIQIIKYSDENSSITIIKNNLDKSANIKMDLFMEEEELKPGIMDIDLTEFTTNMMCGMLQLAFFDKEGLEELIDEWNQMDGVVETEEGEIAGEPEANPLVDYNVKKVEFSLKDKTSKSKISGCLITGKSESEITIN